jgi:hypothetical protein
MAHTDRLQDRLQDRPECNDDRYIGHKAASPDPSANMCNTAGTSAQYDPTAFLNDLFSYHPARIDQVPKYQAIRSAAKHLAEIILTNTRDCGDRERAITLLRQSVHMANAAVAMDGRF